MADIEVKCITKPNLESKHEHITHVGNPASAPPWRWTRAAVIAQIDAKTNTFHTVDPKTKKKAYIKVVRVPGRDPYIQTEADGILTDNLLHLPQCPNI
jgi:hypothetical protein